MSKHFMHDHSQCLKGETFLFHLIQLFIWYLKLYPPYLDQSKSSTLTAHRNCTGDPFTFGNLYLAHSLTSAEEQTQNKYLVIVESFPLVRLSNFRKLPTVPIQSKML